MMQLTPFKINTSKKSCHFRIALILNDFKPIRINTSTIAPIKPPRINTSKKHGGGVGCGPTGSKLYLKFAPSPSAALAGGLPPGTGNRRASRGNGFSSTAIPGCAVLGFLLAARSEREPRRSARSASVTRTLSRLTPPARRHTLNRG